MLQDDSVSDLTSLMKPNSPVITHGYVHGHVHHHKNHVHIHGHIHNHDHIHEESNQVGTTDLTLQQSPDACKQFQNELDLCGDIFCEDLDDCYFLQCDDLDVGSEKICDASSQPLDNGCFHDERNNFHHDQNCHYNSNAVVPITSDQDLLNVVGQENMNSQDKSCVSSLCQSQKPKLNIFESLINNVQQNIEQFTTQQTTSTELPIQHNNRGVVKSESLESPNLHLHFPHHCHQEEPVQLTLVENLDLHTVHQSCFHAKIPLNVQHTTNEMVGAETKFNGVKSEQFDFDFFAQFNNFGRIMDTNPSQMLPYALPHNSFNCQWDHCAHLIDNTSLVDHVVDTHLKQENRIDDYNKPNSEFECEWDHCNFMDTDLNVFMEHLRSHRIDTNRSLPASAHEIKKCDELEQTSQNNQYLSPLLTPRSMETNSESPKSALRVPVENPYALSITELKISPKVKASLQIADANFTCKWHVGKDLNGEPIICNKTHADEGELQAHLQNDHIGLGRSVYHCCWDGCERHNGKSFIQRQKLYRHIHIHTGHKPWKCEICGSLFAVSAMLKQHMRTHSGEKPYKCTMCDKLFATSSSLGIHTRVHLGVKPLKCLWPGCGRYFRESSNLTKHMKTHRTYTCSVCQEQFDIRKDYTKHCRLHEPSRKRKEVMV